MKTGIFVSVGGALVALPAAAQTEPAAQQSQPAAEEAAPEETGDHTIVVTGLRGSLQSARERKRNADQILDAVVAEDIGKLPDNSAAEALARITGVQVARQVGEVNQVLVRGLPDASTTFNGREIFSYDGRNVALQDFPAAALQGLEVYKSTTADQIEGGIAGLVNVRSRRPFDFDGFEIAGAVRGTYNEEADKYDPNVSLLLSDRWETGIGEIGALLNVAYAQQTFLTSARTDGGDVGQAGADQLIITPGVGRDFFFPEAVGVFYARGKRWRPSVDGSIQWRPADNFEVYIEGLYQGFRGRDANDSAIVFTRAGSPTLSNVVLDPDDPTKVRSLTVSDGDDFGLDLQRSVNSGNTNTFQGAIGAKWETGPATLSTDFAYTDSRWDLTQYAVDFAAASPPTVDIDFDRDGEGGGAEFGFPAFDLTDPAGYIVRGIFDRRQRLVGTGVQWRGDLQLDTELSLIPRFDFGLRYTNRTSRGENGERYANLRDLRIPLGEVPFGEGAVISPGFRGLDAQPHRAWFAPTADGVTANIAALRDFAYAGLLELDAENAANWTSDLPAYNPLQAFDAREKTYTAYGQFHYEFDAGVPIDGVVGARIVNTDGRLTGTSQIDGEPVPLTLSQNYVDVLPSASFRAQFTDNLQLRLSATKTRTRPAFSQLNPAVLISPADPNNPGADRFGSGGNIDLQPLESKNYDASLEYYFSDTGSATLAIFRRDVTGFIANYTAPEDVPGIGTVLVTRPRNGGTGRIEGAEAAFTTFLDFLPSALSGLGMQANVTYIDGKQALPAELGADAPDVDIPGVSKWSYNLVALYEKGPVSARLAYNYRSRFVNFFFNPADVDAIAGEYTRGIERLDFSLAITPVEAVTLTFEVANITNQPFRNVRNYTDTQAYPRDIRYDGRLWAIGARFRF
ncbi:TonB-dependent receptor [Pelagerythrobacter sp.]|uniref:TonB-dependent receptor n=1 Tax=Pelagerythrobacter sp. TaxID=2800702 RepID=UPI0035AE9D93